MPRTEFNLSMSFPPGQLEPVSISRDPMTEYYTPGVPYHPIDLDSLRGPIYPPSYEIPKPVSLTSLLAGGSRNYNTFLRGLVSYKGN